MRNPPKVLKTTIQKLLPATESANLILRIQYDSTNGIIPELMYIHVGADSLLLRDDGIAPDLVANDYKYAVYLFENLSALKEEIGEIENKLNADGGYEVFVARSPVYKEYTTPFNMSGFDAGAEIELPEAMIEATNCITEIKKENSLFITDLSVVEDPARTYNIVTREGNPHGAWTFGTLMKNAAGVNASSATTKAFIKSWLSMWTTPLVSGGFLTRRSNVFAGLVEPWLRRSNNDSLIPINIENWETVFDTTNADSLIVNAPFKLMAIVNRVDVRSNNLYSLKGFDVGETRFIFTLISPYNVSSGSFGNPPQHTNDDFSENGVHDGFLDWQGMNVIFEYRNVQTNVCELRDFAQQWLNLSEHDLPTTNDSINTDYNDALEAITATITTPNAISSAPNGSALLRIRSNEKVFATVSGQGVPAWDAADWELTQVEINPTTGLLKRSLLPNTPPNEYNMPTNVDKIYTNNTYLSNNKSKYISWALANKAKILSGTFVMPDSLIGYYAVVDGEQGHYWDFDWANVPVSIYDIMSFYDSATSREAQIMRHQISLNTCQGCHAAETKTMFTQMRPVGYGVKARYWGNYPDTVYRIIDARYNIAHINTGQSNDTISKTYVPNMTLPPRPQTNNPTPRKAYQIVSPFLTGRVYHGNNQWEDDEFAPFDQPDSTVINKPSDETLAGEFYVWEPSNALPAYNYNAKGNVFKWGYNDLKRRKTDLCKLVNRSCGIRLWEITMKANFQPLPAASH